MTAGTIAVGPQLAGATELPADAVGEGATRNRDVEAAGTGDRIDTHAHAVEQRVDGLPRLGDDGTPAHVQCEWRPVQPQQRPRGDDSAAAGRGILTLTVVAQRAVAAIAVGFALFAAAYLAVATHLRQCGAYAVRACRAHVGAGQARLAALFSGIDATVAAIRQLALVGADVVAGTDRPRVAVEVEGRRVAGSAGVKCRTGGAQMEVGAGHDEEVCGHGQEGMQVVAQTLPGGERDDRVARVRAEAVHDAVVVADEPGAARGVDGDDAAEGMVVIEDVVEHGVARRAGVDVDAPAPVGGIDDGVVDHQVVHRAGGAVNLIEADAAGVIIVEQVVAYDAVGDAVHVDG